MRKIVQKKRSFNNEIKCHERPRMQDFAPFIPEALGAIKGTDGTICLLLFNFLLLLQNLLTSLHDITEILLKVALNTINLNQAKKVSSHVNGCSGYQFCLCFYNFSIRFFNIGVENLSSRETTNLLQVIDKIYQIKLYRV